MFLLKDEYKILCYIEKNPNIAKTELVREFPHFKDWEEYLLQYISKIDKNYEIYRKEDDDYNEKKYIYEIPEYVNGDVPEPEPSDNPDNITYYLKHLGKEVLAQKRHDFWYFFIPWSITTVIAFSGGAIYGEMTNFL